MVNTMMEALVPELENLSKGQSLMAILSNLATESLVTATCRLSTRFLSRNKEEAHDLAKKMEMASQLAQVDPYRAATHNKGIFNGIDALVIATETIGEQLRPVAMPMQARMVATEVCPHGLIIRNLRN